MFQVPAKPNYSLVLYYAAERPVKKNSLLSKFIEGTDMFRDSRFKLIPSIIEVTLFDDIKNRWTQGGLVTHAFHI